MKVILSHPTSNQFNRAAAIGLLEADMLSEFYTTIASFPGYILDKLGSIGPTSEIRRRSFEPALMPYTKTWPWLEVGRLTASKLGLNGFIQHETGPFCLDAVYQKQDKRVASKMAKAVTLGANSIYAYEDGAAFSFREAKRLGIKCLYDLPIGYWRTAHKILSQERERWPDWAPTLTGLQDSEYKLARKDEELLFADQIFVASSFTANTLKDYPGKLAPIEVIPYGFPPVVKERRYSALTSGKPLKLLFVGGLSQRKGIADLFSVADILKPYITLTVVGHKTSHDCPALDAALAKHKWIPSLPHTEILKLMHEHDVLVFPSLFEGFGLVITEAMSQGTPVITTDRTAGPDLIEHGVNGWLTEAGSIDALQESIEQLLLSPQRIAVNGKAAMETAARRPWSVYAKEITETILNRKLAPSP